MFYPQLVAGPIERLGRYYSSVLQKSKGLIINVLSPFCNLWLGGFKGCNYGLAILFVRSLSSTDDFESISVWVATFFLQFSNLPATFRLFDIAIRFFFNGHGI
jgi:hypothetical protein